MTTKLSRAAHVQEVQSRLSAVAGTRNGLALGAVTDVGPEQEGQTSAELWLYGVVGGYWFGFNDKAVADQLRGLAVDRLTVRLNSPGGDAIQGIAIGNLLRNHKAHVTVVIDGLAASAASIIAIAGDDVVMSPGAQFMVHDPWFFTMGNAKELRQEADFLDKQGANMAGVYAREAGGTAEQWRAAMTADPDGTWYSDEESVSAGLASRVGTVVAVGSAPEPAEVDPEEDDLAARAAWDLEVLISPAARSAWSAHTKPPSASVPGSITIPEGEPAMAFTPEQLTQMRKDLGLKADADEATIVAALSEVVDESAPDAPNTPQIPEGMSLVDTTVLEELRSGIKLGESAAATLAAQDRDREITAALAAGKIAPTSKAKFEEQWDKDPAGTKAILDVLTPGMVPTTELGHGGSPDADTSAMAPYNALYGTEQKEA